MKDLSPSTTYYWQVRAVDIIYILGRPFTFYRYADAGNWWSFRTTFLKSGPANGSTGVSVTPSLSWGAYTPLQHYEVCIDTVNNGECDTQWVNVGTLTSFRVPVAEALQPATTYYWQVRAVYVLKIFTFRVPADTGDWWRFTTVSRVIGLSGSLAFGNVAVGAAATRTLTINNSGTGALSVTSIAYPAGFSGGWNGTVPAGGSQPVTVTFAPTLAASYGGTVTVMSNKTSGTETTSVSGKGIVTHGDVSGDGMGDVLWRHVTAGDVWLWPMDGAMRTAEWYVHTVAEPGWEIRGLGDQTGDGKADVLWRNAQTGMLYLWTMDGKTITAQTYLATVDPAYDIVGTGDYNGDGQSDILWRHLTNGELWMWLMNGTVASSKSYVATIDPGYDVVGSGDMNADLKSDIVWRHRTSGDVWVWLMNGAASTQRAYIRTVSELGYEIVGVADHTGDGKADILWRHTTRGEVWLWPGNGVIPGDQVYIGSVPDIGYRIVGSNDYDGDGRADILWHHATLGEVWVWLLDGGTVRSQNYVATVADTGYQIVKVK